MTDITYDPEADAVYIAVARGKVERTEEAGPFIYDVDAEGHIIGIEVLSASKVLAPGDWKKAGPPKARHISAAEWPIGAFAKGASRSQGLGRHPSTGEDDSPASGK